MVAKRKTINLARGWGLPLLVIPALGLLLSMIRRRKMKQVYRGEVYYAALSPVVGSEQDGIRPVLVLQNNTGNHHSPTTIVAPITSAPNKGIQPTHTAIDYGFLESESVVLLEQIRTIDKERLLKFLGRISAQDMRRVETAMNISLGIQKERHRYAG